MPRQRHGSFSETQRSSAAIVNQHSGNFHFRSRSTSGRFRHMKTPGNNPAANDYFGNVGSNNHATIHLMSSKSNDQLDNVNNNSTSSEPIYSEPFPPDHQNFEVSELKSSQSHQLNSKIISSKANGKFFPDPRDPVQINNHIYEYLVSKRVAEEHRRSQDNLINVKRRGSLSSSPSDGSSTNNSKQPDFSSGKPHPFFFMTAKTLVFADDLVDFLCQFSEYLSNGE